MKTYKVRFAPFGHMERVGVVANTYNDNYNVVQKCIEVLKEDFPLLADIRIHVAFVHEGAEPEFWPGQRIVYASVPQGIIPEEYIETSRFIA